MRFDVHTRAGVMKKLNDLSEEMKNWDAAPKISEEEIKKLRKAYYAVQTSDEN